MTNFNLTIAELELASAACLSKTVSWTEKKQPELAQQQREVMHKIDAELEDRKTGLTTLGADCDCDERDANEIPVYLTGPEIDALEWALKRITFGDLDDNVDSLELHRAMKEVRQVSLR